MGVVVAFVGIIHAGPAAAEQLAASASPGSAAPDPVLELLEEIAALRADYQALQRTYDERLSGLERRLEELRLAATPADEARGVVDAVTAAPQPAAVAPEPAPQAAAAPVAGNVFNPDISLIGNFVGTAGRNPNGEDPSLSLTEAELSFRSVVDAYARADFYLGVSSEGIEIEEGAITFTALPANLLLRVGKLKAQFGKVNTLHTHQLPYVDRPLVSMNLIGGEEGFSDSGVSLSHLIPNPVMFMEVTGEVYQGDSDVFHSDARSRLAYVGRFRAYRDLTEASNLDLGTSIAYGPTDVDPGPEAEGVLAKTLYGVDATFRYRPLRRAIYRRLNLRSELVWAQQDLPFGRTQTAFGVYGTGEYQFARRWYIGGRLDRSARLLEPDLVDTGGAVFLTFWPTEFSQIRGQFRRINYGNGTAGTEALVQFNFGMGAHGAHVF